MRACYFSVKHKERTMGSDMFLVKHFEKPKELD